MIVLRPFRNSDPPILKEIWRQVFSEGAKNLVPMSINLLTENVLGLPYFDPAGLLIAFEDEKPLGFAHASFGPNAKQTDIDPAVGVICLILVVPDYPDPQGLIRLLLQRSEEYLIGRGAKLIYGGSTRSSVPFYSGLYGGSEPLGVYESDEPIIKAYIESGYETLCKTLRFRQDLRNYRVPFTPKSVVWKRKLVVEYSNVLPSKSWFQSCTTTHFDWFEATAYLEPRETTIGKVLVRISRPMDAFAFGVMVPPTAALLDVWVHPDYHRKGIATFLVGETVRRLISEYHVNLIEALALMSDDSSASELAQQTVAPESELPLLQLIQHLGWNQTERGVIFAKTVE